MITEKDRNILKVMVKFGYPTAKSIRLKCVAGNTVSISSTATHCVSNFPLLKKRSFVYVLFTYIH